MLDQGRYITAGVLNALLLLNPADAYRLFNLSGFANVSLFSGMAGLAKDTTLGASVLLGALLAWTVIPLLFASAVFARREL